MPNRHVSVLIVGSGFSGIGAAIRLEKAGRTDYLIIERGNDLGGTWRDNTYPGAACDVQSQLYSFSFALSTEWSRIYPGQQEIQAYLRRTAEKFRVTERIKFDCAMVAAQWDEHKKLWSITTTNGEYTAAVLVTAFGGLSEPRMPDIPGMATFRGPVFHTARWNHGVDLTGKRVAVIGTGASAIQAIPEIAERAAHLDVFQRTPSWILPRGDRTYSGPERFAFRHVPGWQRLVRGAMYGRRELNTAAFCYAPRILQIASRQSTNLLFRQISDPGLRARLTPDYLMGCKRVLLSDNYYPTFNRKNVRLVTDRIEQIRPDGIVTESGELREVDVVVVATGFHATDSPSADLITGADGRTLAEHWRDFGQQAYKGTSVAGFPNLFTLIGPYTGVGTTSMIYMIESQLNYLVDALRTMDRRKLATVDVREEMQARFNQRLQKRMARTVWASGCRSWYLDATGRNTTLWPNFGFVFRAITRRFDLHAYRVTW
jgi:cation diffusion facilitator CzcD-associated flavoprotein CzcO